MKLSLQLGSRSGYITGQELEDYYKHSAGNADKVRHVVSGMRELLSEDNVGTIEVEVTFPRGDTKTAYVEHTLAAMGSRDALVLKEWEILYDLVEVGRIRQKFYGHKFYCDEINELLDQMNEQAREHDEETENLVYDTIERFEAVMDDLDLKN